jgi:hypothetical protein
VFSRIPPAVNTLFIVSVISNIFSFSLTIELQQTATMISPIPFFLFFVSSFAMYKYRTSAMLSASCFPRSIPDLSEILRRDDGQSDPPARIHSWYFLNANKDFLEKDESLHLDAFRLGEYLLIKALTISSDEWGSCLVNNNLFLISLLPFLKDCNAL